MLFIRGWFEPRSNIPWLKMIVWVTGILRRTVVDDWCFDNLCGSHLRSYLLDYEDGFRTGCRNVSRHQQSFSRLQSCRWSFSIKELFMREAARKLKRSRIYGYHSARHDVVNNLKVYFLTKIWCCASREVELVHLGYQTTWCRSNCHSKKIAKLTFRALSLFPTGQNVRPLGYQLHEVSPQNMRHNRFGSK